MRVGGDEVEFEVTHDDGLGGLVAAEVTMAPGGGPPALHRHAASELYRVEAGALCFYVEDEAGVVRRRIAAAGETVAIPGDREHTIRNESAFEAKAFVVYSPGERMEAFARAAARIDEGSAPSVERVFELAEEYGIEITRGLEAVA